MSFMDLAKERCSVRAFKDIPVGYRADSFKTDARHTACRSDDELFEYI